MSETLIEAKSMTAGYGQVSAIKNIDLVIRAGEVVTLLGPNGAGKTTTLLALMGLIGATAGSVESMGIAVRPGRSAKLARAGVIMVPDDRGVFPDLTVEEHFRLARGKADEKHRDEVLGRFPALRGLLGRKAGLLSGGEQQMLAIAKSLMSKPRVLMVDEMSLGLAPIIVQEMLPGIRDLAKQEGIGVLLVEQHVQLALAVSDRAVVLSRGRVVLEEDAAVLIGDQARIEEAYFGGKDVK